MVAVIGRHVELKRSGRTWKGNCVFHGERTPSFHVYPEDKHFKCYGCGAYGDVFAFLQRLEGKEFPEVVRALAQEVGVEIPEAAEEDSAEARARRKERNEILAACDAAGRYWAARLASRFGEGARAYLASRGVSEESIRRFRLGVAADAWNDLAGRLAEKGVGPAALKRAGLVIERERDGGGTYDRFRNRLMFPIAAMDGQVIGFGGRALGAEQGAKYLNTPETPLYKKSKVLYGLDLAREAIRKTRSAVLVEGYFDVIGLHQVGLANAVAVCGTALTPEHVELLTRCDCREVTVLFDGDAAGLAAPAKAAQALFPAGMAGKVAVLPSDAGKTDPDLIPIHYLMALNYYRKKDFAQAIAEFKEVLKLDPKYSLATFYLGLAYGEASDFDTAIVYLNKALELDPTNFSAAFNLGSAYLRKNRVNDAVAAFERSVSIYPDYAEGHEALGEMYLYLKRNDDAMKELERAVALSPEFRKAHYHLGRAYAAKDPKFPEAFEQSTRTVLQEVASLTKIVDEFSGFAKFPPPKLAPDDLNEIIRSAIPLFAQQVQAGELTKAVKQFVSATLSARKTMQGQAQDLGGNWLAANDLNFSERYLAAVKRVTPADVQRVAREYLRPQTRVVGIYVPTGNGKAKR